jgi:predicted outer membrane repeat protein
MRVTRCPILGMVTTFLFVAAGPALAERSIIVGDGTRASCIEPALQAALDEARAFGGGKIRFDCGADPITMTLPHFPGYPLPQQYNFVVPDRTTIDGDGRIAFERDDDLDDNGGRLGVMFYVGPGTTAALIGLNLLGRHAVIGVRNEGELTVRDTIARRLGLGFFNATTGSLAILNSAILEGADCPHLFSQNAVQNAGDLLVDHTAFADYCGEPKGSIGRFLRGGGAIASMGSLAVRNSTFTRNGTRSSGGAISSTGSLAIKNSTFTENHADGGIGGAIYATGDVTIENSEFIRNEATHTPPAYGGAIALVGPAVIKNSMFSGNRSNYGGAIAALSVTIENSTIVENTAYLTGGGLYLGGYHRSGDVTIRNSTISRNVAGCFGVGTCKDGGGGGIFLYGDAYGHVNLELVGSASVTENTPDDIAPR